MTNSMNSVSRWFFTVLALIPSLALVVFYGWVIEARVVLGYWPHFAAGYADFNRARLLDSHSSFANLAICAGVYSSLFWLLFLAFRTLRGRFLFIPDFIFGIYFVSLFFMLALMLLDPGGFFGWFMGT